ncbi:MAG: type IV pilus twitching motility protein PilT [Burkholderiales bacterium]|nr:type IV pilus twitching motility protein PilT [Burkholderiales bacterium]MDE2286777.1 type IV pilus twitching motility protein PilT [Burkholderiales bacterium]MDE2610405.1 type IV pilus twitching motility protein PilT [Burkholderiales bacterium]
MELGELLRRAAQCGASDLHLSAGMPPCLRIDGELVSGDTPRLAGDDIAAALHDLMDETQRARHAARHECDFSLDWPGLPRVRVNAFWQARGPAAALRLIARDVPSLASLQLPDVLGSQSLKAAGLVLVTGPTGSGKSTTLAALLDHRNRCHAGHILTIEDPIEYVHASHRSLVTQREVGAHTHSFASALRAALREDPDAILLGELRDLDTIRLALTAAETGHLVFGTLHTRSAAQAVERIVDVFPGDEKQAARALLAESLEAVIAQVLVRRADGPGRLAAQEILLSTPAARNLIREGKTAQLQSVLQTGQHLGMQTFEQHLAALAAQGRIDRQAARPSHQPAR